MTEADMVAFRRMVEGMNLTVTERRLALFRPIVIETPAVANVGRRLMALYRHTLNDKRMHEMRLAQGIPSILPECSILTITGASHCGKSTAVKAFAYHTLPASDVEKGSLPMIVVSLTEEATIRDLWCDILRAFGDPEPSGPKQRLQNRAIRLAAEHGTHIVAIDETQHLSKRLDQGTLHNALKRIVQRSQFAIVLIGEKHHIRSALADIQVGNRAQPKIVFDRFDGDREEEREQFMGFLANLDDAMVRAGVFDAYSRLAEGIFLDTILLHTKGYVGVASKIIEMAIEHYSRDDDACLTLAAFTKAAIARADNVNASGSVG
ncbi:TniB family NTP-binding protein [Aureimonas phyllosphaerae]|uniref:Type II secretory pathway predicted ATPase ExeA n=1 Tax=Aureimonas phyllosphaerae TaxID=1166078 RepID=A0A7W6BUN2_9HYPH|nr:TniB family NTP-binding protein [Aureimonas phyllosphaerae]MBB3937237.1 type II secretory pathway predicted ATPase ExeA [Aureimonas phyllosphaerae]MBB3961126.1 type II secretory pathway predicted ATPase ExeA [Aureimonas phyllosphaerae]SFF49261.1 TniB protein [Aureimonas phyllosphaerae]